MASIDDDTQEKVAALARHPVLRGLSQDDLARLASFTRIVVHPARKRLFSKGDPGDSLEVVLSGAILIAARGMDGREVVFNVMGPGDMFGEIAVMDGGERSADARALKATRSLTLARRDLLAALEREPRMALELITLLCKRLRELSEELEDSVNATTAMRLARKLLTLDEHFGRDEAAGRRIALPLSQRMLAGMVGATRESVNRQLSEWTRAGLLRFEPEGLLLFDRTGLMRLVES